MLSLLYQPYRDNLNERVIPVQEPTLLREWFRLVLAVLAGEWLILAALRIKSSKCICG